MSTVNDFLTKEDEQEVVNAIALAEKRTSGEIRVHIESTTSIDAFERATEVFHQLEMDKTQLKNGVLIYIAIQDHKFAICGDKGINEVVEPDFWDCTRDIMRNHFKNGNFKQGLIDGILRAGEKLSTYFPCDDCDMNELSNEISKG
ncbi:MAG: TPM domain-containing protein [Flavobacterium sp.]